MKIKITIEYDYQGDETLPENAALSEHAEWLAGNVTFEDVAGLAKDDADFKIAFEAV